MESSFETEMPTATGVFKPDSSQPYMPPEIEKDIVANVQVIPYHPTYHLYCSYICAYAPLHIHRYLI